MRTFEVIGSLRLAAASFAAPSPCRVGLGVGGGPFRPVCHPLPGSCGADDENRTRMASLEDELSSALARRLA
jgi:hypothetical protein